MGKIVKYCANCEESFAEKFSFCPNCATSLSAYEMNPVMPAAKPEEPVKAAEPVKAEAPAKIAEPVIPAAPIRTAEPVKAEAPASNPPSRPEAKPTSFEVQPLAMHKQAPVESKPEPVTASFSNPPAYEQADDFLEMHDDEIEEPAPIVTAASIPVSTAPNTVDDYNRTYNVSNGNGSNGHNKNNDNGHTADYHTFEAPKAASASVKPSSMKLQDDGYHITFVEEKNNGTRRGLLLGAFMLVTFAALGGLIASLYTNDAFVGALDEQDLGVYLPTEVAEAIEPEPPPKPKVDKDAGGGGGGGDNKPTPVSKGRLAPQEKTPQIPPSVTMDQVTRPELVLRPATQGTRKEPPSTERYGNPNSTATLASDGEGSGGGQGAGSGRGQGNGRGTGAGNGVGSGNGNGFGDGNGNGRGSGIQGEDPPEITKPVGPTEAIKIIAKPRPNYTDAARQNQVQGTVTLRVTFLANGAIGSISPVNGLPNGLTEQAIAAARNIKFEPAKKGGVPQTVTKQVQYNFTLY